MSQSISSNCMFSKNQRRNLLIAGLSSALACQLMAQSVAGVGHRVELPRDSPVTLVSDDWPLPTVSTRGGVYSIQARVSLSLRNASQKRIRGVTLAVMAQENAPGGKGSISVPSLDIAPGDTFVVRGDLHLLRPVTDARPSVEVNLDGLLFDDLSFYGPDRLSSRRTLMVWELEARRDRQYLKAVLEQRGVDGLQKEMIASSSRDGLRLQFSAQVVRGAAAGGENEREVVLAFVQSPDAPLEAMAGVARVARNEARAPKMVIQNRSGRAVRYFEIGWVVRDQQGREFMAASLPSEMRLPPHSSSQILEDASLRFDSRTPLEGMTGFISTVEFSDGTFWIPSRNMLEDPLLRRTVAPSPEQQRLLQIYIKRGVNALIDDLKRF